MFGIRQVGHANDSPDENPGQGAGDHDPGQRPHHPALSEIAIHPAGDGHDIEQLVSSADRGIGVAEKRHLKRQQKECTRNAAHGGEKRYYECDQRGNPGRDFDACGMKKHAPETIRKARAVELMQGNMPLPAVQMLLGHSTPNQTSAYVSFSEEDIRELTRLYLERESTRKTSARNAFFGKIAKIRQGDIQSRVELTTFSGHIVTAIITNDSLRTLGLREDRLATAEVKAPWVTLHKGGKEPVCSAENRYRGLIVRRTGGEINTEYVVRLADGTELCAIAGTPDSRSPDFMEGDAIWALFNCCAVVLHLE
jgi:molybdopterin-binding protein